MDSKEKTKGEEDTQVNKARLTVTCKNLKSIEKCLFSSFSFTLHCFPNNIIPFPQFAARSLKEPSKDPTSRSEAQSECL